MTNAVKDWLNDAGGDFSKYPAFKFRDIGDAIVGRIVETPRLADVPDINGKGMVTKLIICIETQASSKGFTGPAQVYDPITVGETYSLWLGKGYQAQAANEALKKAGVDGFREDDVFAMAFTEEKDTGKPQPARIYEAELRASKPKVGVKALLGDD
jgi:hypothetical protein